MRPSPPQGMPLRPLPGPVVVIRLGLVDADALRAEVQHPAVVDALADLEEWHGTDRADQPARPQVEKIKAAADALPFDEDVGHRRRLRRGGLRGCEASCDRWLGFPSGNPLTPVHAGLLDEPESHGRDSRNDRQREQQADEVSDGLVLWKLGIDPVVGACLA